MKKINIPNTPDRTIITCPSKSTSLLPHKVSEPEERSFADCGSIIREFNSCQNINRAAHSATIKITGKNARQCLEAVIAEDKDPAVIVKERGWEIIMDPAIIATAARAVAESESDVLDELKNSGISEKRRQTLTAFLVGKVLAATGGRADPKIAGNLVNDLISGK